MHDHDQRVALVTGANRGIGFAICRQLAQKGIAVILASRDLSKGQAACSRLNREGFDVGHTLQLDVSAEDSIRSAIEQVKKIFKRLDILVNNAGIVADDKATILVNSACPEWVKTDMGGKQAPLSPDKGADTPVWLATLPDDGPSGGFFRDRERIAW